MVNRPQGRVLRVVFRRNVIYAEVEGLCSRYGSVHHLSQKENSFHVYLKNDLDIEKIDRIITRLRKNDRKVRDVILMPLS